MRVLACALVCCYGVAPASANDTAELADAAARLQYAFYTNDARGLEQTLASLERLAAPAAPPGLKDYYLAFGRWKLARLTLGAEPSSGAARTRAAKQAQACRERAQASAERAAHPAEAYALLAACSDMTQSLRLPSLWRDSAAGCLRSKAWRRAHDLAPNNPRVLLVAALCVHERSAPGDAPALERLREVVRAFEAAGPARVGPGEPDWGQAEALTLLGQRYLESGQALAARDAIERALVLAPDYRAAQDLLEQAARRAQ